MIEVFVFIWIVGAMFTCGLTKSLNVLQILLTIIGWPTVLGMIIRMYLTGE